MKALMSALVAMTVLAGVCAPGYSQAYDRCVQDGGGGS
jgi:hypothetical protein